MGSDELSVIERLQRMAEEAILRLDAAKAKFAPLRDAVDKVMDEIRKLREGPSDGDE